MAGKSRVLHSAPDFVIAQYLSWGQGLHCCNGLLAIIVGVDDLSTLCKGVGLYLATPRGARFKFLHYYFIVKIQ